MRTGSNTRSERFAPGISISSLIQRYETSGKLRVLQLNTNFLPSWMAWDRGIWIISKAVMQKNENDNDNGNGNDDDDDTDEI